MAYRITGKKLEGNFLGAPTTSCKPKDYPTKERVSIELNGNTYERTIHERIIWRASGKHTLKARFVIIDGGFWEVEPNQVKGDPLGTRKEREAWEQSMASRNGGLVFRTSPIDSRGRLLPDGIVNLAGFKVGSMEQVIHCLLNVDTGEEQHGPSWVETITIDGIRWEPKTFEELVGMGFIPDEGTSGLIRYDSEGTLWSAMVVDGCCSCTIQSDSWGWLDDAFGATLEEAIRAMVEKHGATYKEEA